MSENQANSPLIDPSIVSNAGVATAASAEKSKRQVPDKGGFIWGVGRRKSAVARVRMKPGSGKLLVNDKELDDFFRLKKDRDAVLAPLNICEIKDRFDVFVNVQGGGTTGQAGAALLGIARAMINFDESFAKSLRDAGHLTRDGRMKERKKPGQRGARRKFQFSKR